MSPERIDPLIEGVIRSDFEPPLESVDSLWVVLPIEVVREDPRELGRRDVAQYGDEALPQLWP